MNKDKIIMQRNDLQLALFTAINNCGRGDSSIPGVILARWKQILADLNEGKEIVIET